MKIQNITQQNFNGYKNFFCGETKEGNSSISYMSFQLTDEGTPDLTKWKNIRNLSTDLKSEQLNEDTITLLHIKNGKNKELIMNNKKLPNLKDLKQLDKFKKVDSLYNEEINFSLKAYTFLANIFNRMQTCTLYDRDKDISKVIKTSIDRFNTISNNDKDWVCKFLDTTLTNYVDATKLAKTFNDHIIKTMANYLK